MVIQGNITIGVMITIYMAADRVTSPLISLANIYNNMAGSEPLLRKVLDSCPSTEPTLPPVYTNQPDYLVHLEDVSVGYDKNHPVLENLNFKIRRGDKILIEGPSGSGKSTLLKTILNEQDPLSGSLKYGQNLQGKLTDTFAVVEQQPFVFHNTLRYNLVLGKSVPDEKLYAVLKKVGLDSLADETGLGTEIGSGRQLSGGELKRLEVARAMLNEKDILIVDEALSGLDSSNADRLNQLIIDYPGTVINIEHRLTREISSRFNKTLKLGEYK